MTFTYFDGKLDCKNGIPHQPGKGEAYDMGYGYQHQRKKLADNDLFENLLKETEKRERREQAQ